MVEGDIVLRQGCIDGCSVTVVLRNKAQYAGNGLRDEAEIKVPRCEEFLSVVFVATSGA